MPAGVAVVSCTLWSCWIGSRKVSIEDFCGRSLADSQHKQSWQTMGLGGPPTGLWAHGDDNTKAITSEGWFCTMDFYSCSNEKFLVSLIVFRCSSARCCVICHTAKIDYLVVRLVLLLCSWRCLDCYCHSMFTREWMVIKNHCIFENNAGFR